VALNPDLNQSDGMHPNKEGTVEISKNLSKKILEIKSN
jgi:acyl-CoA thioesterase-1